MGETIASNLSDTYFELVRLFPLVSIRDESHLFAAQDVLDEMLTKDRDAGAEAYFDTLTELVAAYEDEHEIHADGTPEGVLRLLVESSRLNQQELASAAGIAQSTISELLAGKRKFTVGQMEKLGKHFGVPAAVFLPKSGG